MWLQALTCTFLAVFGCTVAGYRSGAFAATIEIHPGDGIPYMKRRLEASWDFALGNHWVLISECNILDKNDKK